LKVAIDRVEGKLGLIGQMLKITPSFNQAAKAEARPTSNQTGRIKVFQGKPEAAGNQTPPFLAGAAKIES